MNILQQHGVIAIMNFAPYSENYEFQSLRKALFHQTQSLSDFAPTSHTDVFDESILVFETFSQASTYLINLLQVAARLRESSDIQFTLRSGVCEGDYFLQQNQIYGESVNQATRLSCTSRENELLMCGLDQANLDTLINLHDDVNYFVRNREENCVSIWLLDPDETASKESNKVLQIKYNQNILEYVPSRSQKILIGRSRHADILIDSDKTSRNHATISLNYHNIFVEDHSSNGTYLYFDNREVFLSNDSMKMSSEGQISCGRKRNDKDDTSDIISIFTCEKARAVA
jgi:adenylate cyclase